MGPAIFDRQVLALDEALFLEALPEGRHEIRNGLRRQNVHEPHDRYGSLLRTRPKRPRRYAAEERDEITPSHPNCPVGLKHTKDGIVRPSKITPPMTVLGQSRPFGAIR
jgi:hypothetical protein